MKAANRRSGVAPNSSLFRVSATQPISRGLLRPMRNPGRHGASHWLRMAVSVAAVLLLFIAAQSPEPDWRTAGSDVVGKLMPVRAPTSMVHIPAAHGG